MSEYEKITIVEKPREQRGKDIYMHVLGVISVITFLLALFLVIGNSLLLAGIIQDALHPNGTATPPAPPVPCPSRSRKIMNNDILYQNYFQKVRNLIHNFLSEEYPPEDILTFMNLQHQVLLSFGAHKNYRRTWAVIDAYKRTYINNSMIRDLSFIGSPIWDGIYASLDDPSRMLLSFFRYRNLLDFDYELTITGNDPETLHCGSKTGDLFSDDIRSFSQIHPFDIAIRIMQTEEILRACEEIFLPSERTLKPKDFPWKFALAKSLDEFLPDY